MASRIVAGREGMGPGPRLLGPVLLGLVLLGLATGRVHAQTEPPAPVPVLTAEGVYGDEHWDGRWRLTRQGRQVTASLDTTHSPVSPAVLFRVPTGFRPERTVTKRVGRARPVDKEGRSQSPLDHNFTLQVARDGTVRYVNGGIWLRYTTTLAWTTDEAACGGGVLHGRTQGVVDALEAQTGLACAAIGPAQLAAVTALDLRGHELAGLRAGDFAGLSALQTLDLRGHGNRRDLAPLPPQLLAGLSALHTLDLSGNDLLSLPAGLLAGLEALQTLNLSHNRLNMNRLPPLLGRLPALQTLDLSGNDLTVLPAAFLSELPALQTLDLSWNALHQKRLPADLLAHLPALQTLDLSHNTLSALPAGLLTGLDSLQTLDLEGNWLTALPAGLWAELSALHTLDLSHNGLTTLPAGLLAGLDSLQTLDLGHNRLQALPAGLLTGLDSLQTLDLGHNRLAVVPAGLAAELAAGRVHFRAPGHPVPAPAPASALTAQGAYGRRSAHWEGRWQLVRRGRQVTATLATARSPVAAPAVLFRVPPGFRPARPVAQTVTPAWPVDGAGQPLAVPARRVALQVARDGTVRYRTEVPGTGEGWVRYKTTLVWLTDEADCGGGVLHGRTQEVVDALVAQTELACADIGPAQLATVTGLDLHGSALPGLRAGDLAGLVALQRLDLSGRGRVPLPAELFAGLVALQHLDLSGRGLTVLPTELFAGLVSLQHLDLSGNGLTVLPTELFAGLVSLQHLDLSGNGLTALPAELFAGLVSLQRLDLGGNGLSPAFLASVQRPGGSDWREGVVLPPLRSLEQQIEGMPPAWLVAEISQAQSLTLEVKDLQSLPADFLAEAPQLQSLRLTSWSLTALPADFLADTPHLHTLDLFLPNLTAWPEGLLTEGHARLQRVTLELHPQARLPPHLLAHIPRLAQVELRGGPRALPAGFLAHTPSLRTLVLPPILEVIGPETLAGTGLVDFALRTEADWRRPGEPVGLTLGAGFLADATHLRTFILRESRGLDALYLPPDFLVDLPHLSAVLLDAPLPLPLPPGFLRGAQLQALQLRLPADTAPLPPLPALVQAQHLLLDLACDTASPSVLFRDWPRRERLLLRPCPEDVSTPPGRP